MSDAVWLALYQLARHLLTTLPSLDTIEGKEERDNLNQSRIALCALIRSTEERYRLPRTFRNKSERRIERLG